MIQFNSKIVLATSPKLGNRMGSCVIVTDQLVLDVIHSNEATYFWK